MGVLFGKWQVTHSHNASEFGSFLKITRMGHAIWKMNGLKNDINSIGKKAWRGLQSVYIQWNRAVYWQHQESSKGELNTVGSMDHRRQG